MDAYYCLDAKKDYCINCPDIHNGCMSGQFPAVKMPIMASFQLMDGHIELAGRFGDICCAFLGRWFCRGGLIFGSSILGGLADHCFFLGFL